MNKTPSVSAQTIAEEQANNDFYQVFFKGADPSALSQQTPEWLQALAQSQYALWQAWSRGLKQQSETTASESMALRLLTCPQWKQDRKELPLPYQSQAWGGDPRRAYLQIVHADMPMLVRSLIIAVNRLGYQAHWLVHPVVPLHSLDAQENQSERASLILLELDLPVDAKACTDLLQAVQSAYADVRQSVLDREAMHARVLDEAQELEDLAVQTKSHAEAAAQYREAGAFLRWLVSDHFVLLGSLHYQLQSDNAQTEERTWSAVSDSALGVVGNYQAQEQTEKPLRTYGKTFEDGPLLLRKSMKLSTVHRSAYLDGISVKRFDAAGKWVGITRFWGLYAARTYHQSNPREIPVIRERVRQVFEMAQFNAGGYSYKALENILYTYPRDELLQVDTSTLQRHALAILRLQDHQKVLVLLRQDPFGSFASVLVYMPRERYDTELRKRLGAALMQALNGAAFEFTPMLTDNALARIHFWVRAEGHLPAHLDEKALEAQISALCQAWDTSVENHLLNAMGLLEGQSIASEFVRLQAIVRGFPRAYQDQMSIPQAAADAQFLAELGPSKSLSVQLVLPKTHDDNARFRVFSTEKLTLSQILPILENMGARVLDESNYQVCPQTESAMPLWLYELDLDLSESLQEPIAQDLSQRFETLFVAVWHKQIESDTLNQLVLSTHLSGENIAILRAYVSYLRQINLPFGRIFIESVLCRNAGLAQQLFTLFATRFQPVLSAQTSEQERSQTCDALRQQLEEGLVAVPSLNDEKVLRQLKAVILATLRTNVYAQRDHERHFLSFKLDSHAVPNLPEPKPKYEVWVFAPHFEGVHLRGGKVARGGLRWSDRAEDFRTEILGLLKAQTVKNTVIVPVGAKGGFVLKQAPLPSQREQWLEEGKRCYQDFLRGLLDITDNLVQGQVQPPQGVVRYDEDDPYLVVAADKGTASFSDLANGVAESYGFWLGDAFASGGSHGYDHKKMGITARGAWVSAQRHFYGLGKNIQTTPFTVAAIGDMSGDVFGNGMLLSPCIQLVFAFDHRDIFIDPAPDLARSFAERQRLFALPRSSWQDYDASLISAGGGIFSRSAKHIDLSSQARQLLGIEATRLSPNELLHAILQAPVDMLYNGGIGTYVKASWQSHAEIGDKLSDAYRVNGNQLRCAVLVEGGNLGCSQEGRIEFATKGGLIYNDAIDNSAGVDCSDHEVNIKILLRLAQDQKRLNKTDRNALLVSMTDKVAALVLRDNFAQTQQLEVNAARAHWLETQAALMDELESIGLLNRANENLPDQTALLQRKEQGLGLTRPESAVLMAYAKMQLMGQLMAGDLVDEAFYVPNLLQNFPSELVDQFSDLVVQHPLKREIIATRLCNDLINRMGATFVFFLQRESGAKAQEVVRAYTVTSAIFELDTWWQAIDAQMQHIPAELQLHLLDQMGRIAQRASRWMLRHYCADMDLSQQVQRYRAGVVQLRDHFSACIPEAVQVQCRARAQEWIDAGVSAELAQNLSILTPLFPVLDLVDLVGETPAQLLQAAKTYYAIELAWELPQWRNAIARLPTQTVWQTQARASAIDETYALAVQTTGLLLQKGMDVSQWQQANSDRIANNHKLLHTLLEQTPDLAPVVVGLHAMHES